MKRLWIAIAVVLVLAAIGAYYWSLRSPQPQPAAPAPAPPAVISPPKPVISHPIEAPSTAAQLPPLAQSDGLLRERLVELLGDKRVKAYLQLDQFVRRVVATVDNLARPLAPPRMWPIRIMPGRFSTQAVAGRSVIDPKNAARYAPFVELVESVDAPRAAALYRELYPLFQRAYEEIGFPGKYFNDRLVQVIDLLLATPEPTDPLEVELPEIEGPLKPTHPWVLYRYVDPALEHLAGGQKMLLRVGLQNEKRLKAKLAELRKQIAQ